MFKIICIFLLAYSCQLVGWQKKLKAAIRSNHPPTWMTDQIKEDLLPFSDGITNEMIQSSIQLNLPNLSKSSLLHCKIFKGKVEITSEIENHPAVIEITRNLKLLASHVPIPDLEFVLSIQSSLDDVDLRGPVFAFAKDSSKKGKVILFPDHEALSGNKNFMKEVKKGVKKYPWKEKLDQAVWRGATAGGDFTTENFLSYPRSQLVSCSLELPELIDAKFTECCQSQEKNEILAQYVDYFSPTLPLAEHLRHKYQILVDGNSCTYTRAYWQLFSNCVILKQTSSNIQWFYRALKPFVHYIPVEYHFQDLPEKIEWAKSNDRKCKKISKAAQDFAKKNLTRDRVFYYVYLLLTEYAKLQKK